MVCGSAPTPALSSTTCTSSTCTYVALHTPLLPPSISPIQLTFSDQTKLLLSTYSQLERCRNKWVEINRQPRPPKPPCKLGGFPLIPQPSLERSYVVFTAKTLKDVMLQGVRVVDRTWRNILQMGNGKLAGVRIGKRVLSDTLLIRTDGVTACVSTMSEFFAVHFIVSPTTRTLSTYIHVNQPPSLHVRFVHTRQLTGPGEITRFSANSSRAAIAKEKPYKKRRGGPDRKAHFPPLSPLVKATALDDGSEVWAVDMGVRNMIYAAKFDPATEQPTGETKVLTRTTYRHATGMEAKSRTTVRLNDRVRGKCLSSLVYCLLAYAVLILHT